MATRKCARCGRDFVPKKQYDYRNKICIDCGGHNSTYPKYKKEDDGLPSTSKEVGIRPTIL